MEKNIFDFEDYKAYLAHVIAKQPHKGHGFKAKMAEGIGCQRAFLSQVLRGEQHLNLEYADKLNQFLAHSVAESDYFLLLVQRARAGTVHLEQQFLRQIRSINKARELLKNRMAHESQFSEASKQRYYSSWQYAAVRVAVTIPDFRTKEALSKRLGIPMRRLEQILDFLVENGFLHLEGTTYKDHARSMHLGNDSALILRHHTNWRLRAMQSLDNEGANDLHYSTVMSISARDAQEFKKLCANFIESLQAKIKASPEETVCSLGIDFYEL